jgi:hypothetical protein
MNGIPMRKAAAVPYRWRGARIGAEIGELFEPQPTLILDGTLRSHASAATRESPLNDGRRA